MPRTFEFKLPQLPERHDILNVILTNEPLDDDVDVGRFAISSDGDGDGDGVDDFHALVVAMALEMVMVVSGGDGDGDGDGFFCVDI